MFMLASVSVCMFDDHASKAQLTLHAQVEVTCAEGYMLSDKEEENTSNIGGETFTLLLSQTFLPPSTVCVCVLFVYTFV